jgi:hypothetical protein
MKNIAYIFLFIVSLRHVTFAQDCEAVVNIKSGSPNHTVLIDNDFAGKGNVNALLNPGIYEVKILENKLGWDTRTIIDTINIVDCNETYEFSYLFEERVKLSTIPSDTYIFHADTLLGHAPMYIPDNTGELTISKTYYIPKVLESNSIISNQPVRLDFIGKEKKEKFVDTHWFKILIGSAVALGAASAYLKIQADQTYDQYLQEHDKDLLKKTERLDTASGITFGLLQVNFGILIYNFIFAED